MLIRVLDFETTGLNPEVDGICEVGWTDIEDSEPGVLLTMDTLTDPGCVISFEAMAVHHIRNEEVAGRKPASSTLVTIQDANVYVAHNMDFEMGFWAWLKDVPTICTWKVALRTHPEAPKHSNQFLRYFLGLPADPDRASPAHRAGPDTYVTALLLMELLKWATLEEMIRWSSGPPLYPRVPFGKFKGKSWDDVPTDYLKWTILSSDMDRNIKINAKHYLDLRTGAK